MAVLGLLFYYCVNRTRRPRFRTLCGIAELKSLWAGGGRELEEASERKVYEILLNSAFKSYFMDVFHKIT